MKIFLDLDGTIVDFMANLHAAMGVEYDSKSYPYPKGLYEMFGEAGKSIGKDDKHIYGLCSGRDFWASMKMYDTGPRVIALAEKYAGKDNVFICTAPTMFPDAWAGKYDWIMNNMPGYEARTIMLTSPKSLLAGKGRYIIDDKEETTDTFEVRGGGGFLVPQPWNRRHCLANKDWLHALECELKRFKDEENA